MLTLERVEARGDARARAVVALALTGPGLPLAAVWGSLPSSSTGLLAAGPISGLLGGGAGLFVLAYALVYLSGARWHFRAAMTVSAVATLTLASLCLSFLVWSRWGVLFLPLLLALPFGWAGLIFSLEDAARQGETYGGARGEFFCALGAGLAGAWAAQVLSEALLNVFSRAAVRASVAAGAGWGALVGAYLTTRWRRGARR